MGSGVSTTGKVANGQADAYPTTWASGLHSTPTSDDTTTHQSHSRHPYRDRRSNSMDKTSFASNTRSPLHPQQPQERGPFTSSSEANSSRGTTRKGGSTDKDNALLAAGDDEGSQDPVAAAATTPTAPLPNGSRLPSLPPPLATSMLPHRHTASGRRPQPASLESSRASAAVSARKSNRRAPNAQRLDESLRAKSSAGVSLSSPQGNGTSLASVAAVAATTTTIPENGSDREELVSLERTATVVEALREVLRVGKKGELECITSGFVSYDDYAFIAETLKSLSDRFLQITSTKHRDGNQQCEGSLADGSTAESPGPTPAGAIATLSSQVLNSYGYRHREAEPSSPFEAHGAAAATSNMKQPFSPTMVSVASTTGTTAVVEPWEVEEPTAEWLTLRHKLLHYTLPRRERQPHARVTETPTVVDEEQRHTSPPRPDSPTADTFAASVTSPTSPASSTAASYVARALRGMDSANTLSTDTTGSTTTAATAGSFTSGDKRTRQHPTKPRPPTLRTASVHSYGSDWQDDKSNNGSMVGGLPRTGHLNYASPYMNSPLAIEELLSITERDDVLAYFLSGASLSDNALRSKLKVMPPSKVFTFFFVSRTRKTFKTAALSAGNRRGSWGNPAATIEAEHFFFYQEEKMIKKLMLKTIALSAKYLDKFSASLPMGVQARLNRNNYLSPSHPVISSLVSCVSAGRAATQKAFQKEYFVSMQERLELISRTISRRVRLTDKLGSSIHSSIHGSTLSIPWQQQRTGAEARMLGTGPFSPTPPPRAPAVASTPHTFTSAEELLLCVAQLSSFASNMISSFSLCAMLAISARIAECRTAEKHRQRVRRRTCGDSATAKAARWSNVALTTVPATTGPDGGVLTRMQGQNKGGRRESLRQGRASHHTTSMRSRRKRRNTFYRALHEPTANDAEDPTTFEKIHKGDVFFSPTFDQDSEHQTDEEDDDDVRTWANAEAAKRGGRSGGLDSDSSSDYDEEEEDGESELLHLPHFVEGYCQTYANLSSKALDTIRRRHPNVFLLIGGEFAEDPAPSPREENPAKEPANPDRKIERNMADPIFDTANALTSDATEAEVDADADAAAEGANAKRNNNPLARPTTLAMAVSLLVKLIFLFTGGVNNIAADDRRANVLKLLETLPVLPHREGNGGKGRKRMKNTRDRVGTAAATVEELLRQCEAPGSFKFPEDVALEAALRIPALSRLTLLARALNLEEDLALIEKLTHKSRVLRGLPDRERERQAKNIAKVERKRKELVYRLVGKAESCAACWRIFLQFLGLLPIGDRCPREFGEWLSIFPFYALNDTAKEQMLLVHGILANYAAPLKRENSDDDPINSMTTPSVNAANTHGNAEDSGSGGDRANDVAPLRTLMTPETIPDLHLVTLCPILRDHVLRSTAELLHRQQQLGELLAHQHGLPWEQRQTRPTLLLAAADRGNPLTDSAATTPRHQHDSTIRNDNNNSSNNSTTPVGKDGPSGGEEAGVGRGEEVEEPPTASFFSPIFATREHGMETTPGTRRDLYELCARECEARFLPDVVLSLSGAAHLALVAGDIGRLDPALLRTCTGGERRGKGSAADAARQQHRLLADKYRNQAVVVVTWEHRNTMSTSGLPASALSYDPIRVGDELTVELTNVESMSVVLPTDSLTRGTIKDNNQTNSNSSNPGTASAQECMCSAATTAPSSGSSPADPSTSAISKLAGSVTDAKERSRKTTETTAQELDRSRTALAVARYRSKLMLLQQQKQQRGSTHPLVPSPTTPSVSANAAFVTPPSTPAAMDPLVGLMPAAKPAAATGYALYHHQSKHHHHHHDRHVATASAAGEEQDLVDRCNANHDRLNLVIQGDNRYVVLAALDGADPHQQIVVLNTNYNTFQHAFPAPSSPTAERRGGSRGCERSTNGCRVGLDHRYIVSAFVHHRKNNPPLMATADQRYTWTNPQYGVQCCRALSHNGAPPTAPAPHHAASTTSTTTTPVMDNTPFTMGFLLGNALSNGNVLQTPLAPLAFRFISRVLRYESLFQTDIFASADAGSDANATASSENKSSSGSPISSSSSMYGTLENILNISPADASLIELSTREKSLMLLLQDPVTILGSFEWEGKDRSANATVALTEPGDENNGDNAAAVGIRKDILYRLTKRFAQEVTDGLLLNIRGSGGGDGDGNGEGNTLTARQRRREESMRFWLEVIRGVKQTSLVRTPLFFQSSSRTIQHLLCGPGNDDESKPFSFLGNFIFSITDRVRTRAYGDFLFKTILTCLEHDFTNAEKRALLKFITGKSLLSRQSHYERNEFIFIQFQVALDERKTLREDATEPVPAAGGGGGEEPDGANRSFASPADFAAVAAAATEPRDDDGRRGGAGSDDVTPSCVITRVTPVMCDAFLARLPSAHDCANMLEIPCYWDFLLVGADSKYTQSKIEHAIEEEKFVRRDRKGGGGGGAAASQELTEDEMRAIAHNVLHSYPLHLSDVNAAWDELTIEEQAEVGRTFRALLAARLQVAVANSAAQQQGATSSQPTPSSRAGGADLLGEGRSSVNCFRNSTSTSTSTTTSTARSETRQAIHEEPSLSSATTLGTSELLSVDYYDDMGSDGDNDDVWYTSAPPPPVGRSSAWSISEADGGGGGYRTESVSRTSSGPRLSRSTQMSCSCNKQNTLASVHSPLPAFRFLQDDDAPTAAGARTQGGERDPSAQEPNSTVAAASEAKKNVEEGNATAGTDHNGGAEAEQKQQRSPSIAVSEEVLAAKAARRRENMHLWNAEESRELLRQDGKSHGAETAAPISGKSPQDNGGDGFRLAISFSFGESDTQLPARSSSKSSQSIQVPQSTTDTLPADSTAAAAQTLPGSPCEDHNPLLREINNNTTNLVAQEQKLQSYGTVGEKQQHQQYRQHPKAADRSLVKSPAASAAPSSDTQPTTADALSQLTKTTSSPTVSAPFASTDGSTTTVTTTSTSSSAAARNNSTHRQDGETEASGSQLLVPMPRVAPRLLQFPHAPAHKRSAANSGRNSPHLPSVRSHIEVTTSPKRITRKPSTTPCARRRKFSDSLTAAVDAVLGQPLPPLPEEAPHTSGNGRAPTSVGSPSMDIDKIISELWPTNKKRQQ